MKPPGYTAELVRAGRVSVNHMQIRTRYHTSSVVTYCTSFGLNETRLPAYMKDTHNHWTVIGTNTGSNQHNRQATLLALVHRTSRVVW